MGYARRHGCTTRRNRCNHDPATIGIFIHGGTITGKGKFPNSSQPNQFGLTLPNRNHPAGEEFHIPNPPARLRTFQQALKYALEFRKEQPLLHPCPIYACTDMILESRCAGRYQVQLLSPALHGADTTVPTHAKVQTSRVAAVH